MQFTESELLLKPQEQLFGIQKMIRCNQIDLDDIAELIPGIIHLNQIHTLDLKYLDRQSRETLEVSHYDLEYSGKKVLANIVKPESFRQAKRLFGHVDFNDPAQVVSHFQELKGFLPNDEYQWFYSVKKRFHDGLILTISNPVSTLGSMQSQVQKILEENRFIKRNLSKINSLTRREKEIIKLTLKGHRSNQIAEMLFISPHTVRTHKKNIWRKLEISSHMELMKYASEFGLL